MSEPWTPEEIAENDAHGDECGTRPRTLTIPELAALYGDPLPGEIKCEMVWNELMQRHDGPHFTLHGVVIPDQFAAALLRDAATTEIENSDREVDVSGCCVYDHEEETAYGPFPSKDEALAHAWRIISGQETT